MSRYVFNCSMPKMIEIFSDLADFPTDKQDFLCEKIDDYHYILKPRPNDPSINYESFSWISSKRYFLINVELSSISLSQQQITCKGNTKNLQILVHTLAVSMGIYLVISDAESINWIRMIFVYVLSLAFLRYYTNTMREEIVLAVRKTIIRKTFIKGNRRR